MADLDGDCADRRWDVRLERPALRITPRSRVIRAAAPIYSFGNIGYVYGVSPDLLPEARMREGNSHAKVKIKPKKSWEIKHGLLGATSEMTVRSPWTDSQPFLPIHLIDGDPETVWCSWGCDGPDARPEWIRIDLLMETTVSQVNLVCAAGGYPILIRIDMAGSPE